jgi:hypothetical protein
MLLIADDAGGKTRRLKRNVENGLRSIVVIVRKQASSMM